MKNIIMIPIFCIALLYYIYAGARVIKIRAKRRKDAKMRRFLPGDLGYGRL
jgi:hypothetical protein